jgi:TonB family protein
MYRNSRLVAIKLILSIALFCCNYSLAQDKHNYAQSEQYIDLKKLIVISTPNGEEFYPLTSKIGGEEGYSAVGLTIDENGRVEKTTILFSSNYPALDSAALEIGKKYQFEPYVIDGNPKKISTKILVKFHLPYLSKSNPLVHVETITTNGCKLIEYQSLSSVHYKKNMIANWDGKCLNGLVSGIGTLTLTMKDGGTQVMRGNMVDGLSNGYFEYSDNRVNGSTALIKGIAYKGILLKGKLEIFFNGNLLQTYDGDFKDGDRTGKAILTRSNGQVEEGEFLNGKLHGIGKITYRNRVIIQSEIFIHGVISENATLIEANGKKYNLTYLDGILISKKPVNY